MVEEGEGAAPVESPEKDEAPVRLKEAEVQDLRDELGKQASQAKEYLALAKRIQADFDNYRKRIQKEREDATRAANDALLVGILGIRDDLERAVHSEAGAEEMRVGLKQILSNFDSFLRSNDVREMPNTETFDTRLHEAVCTGEGEEGKILETFQKGYCVGPRVLRHAKVKVGKTTEEVKENG
ncbi:MAG: nucleotide exchange factor GrpE [Methanomassiliicoccales archaeon]